MMSLRQGCLGVLLFLHVWLLLGCLAAQAASTIERDLRDFADRCWKRQSLVKTLKANAVSPKRYELYGEDHGRGYGAVALKNVTPVGQSGMQVFCTATLARKYEKILFDQLTQKKIDNTTAREFVRLAVAEAHFGSIGWLGYKKQNGVEFVACSTILEKVKPVDIENNWDRYFASASYKAALHHIKQGQHETALSLLKNTRGDIAVYNNALGLIVPLLAEKDPESAIRLEHDFVDPTRMNDPAALLFLERFRRNRGDLAGAMSLLARCLQIDPKSYSCLAEQSALQSIDTSSGKSPDLSYASFFNQ